MNKNIETVLESLLKITPPGHKLFVPKDRPTHIAKTEIQNFISTHRRNVSDKNITFHGLRHTYAAEMYKNLIQEGKTDSEAKLAVSKLLGHEREDVTRIYLGSLKDIK